MSTNCSFDPKAKVALPIHAADQPARARKSIASM
jgi:hypothetical protein